MGERAEITSAPDTPTRLRWVDGDGWWAVLLAVLGAGGLLLVVENAAYWLWVAQSAFFGIRDDAEPILGAFSVLAALAPLTAAVVAWRATGGWPSWVRRLCAAFAAGSPAAMVTIVIAAFMMGPI